MPLIYDKEAKPTPNKSSKNKKPKPKPVKETKPKEIEVRENKNTVVVTLPVNEDKIESAPWDTSEQCETSKKDETVEKGRSISFSDIAILREKNRENSKFWK